jgi:hypothetical protein
MSIPEFMEKFGHYTKEQLDELDDYFDSENIYFNKLEYDTDVLLNDITIKSIDNTDILSLPFGTVKIIYVDYKDRTLCFVNYQLDDYELYDSKTIGYIVFRYLKHYKNIEHYKIILIYYGDDGNLIKHYLNAITSMPLHYIRLTHYEYFNHNDIYYCYGYNTNVPNNLRLEISKQLEEIKS